MLIVHVHLDHILPEGNRVTFYDLMDVYGFEKLDDVLTFWSAEYESEDRQVVHQQAVNLICKLAAIAGITFRGIIVVGGGRAKAFRSNPAARFFIITKPPRSGNVKRLQELVQRLRKRCKIA